MGLEYKYIYHLISLKKLKIHVYIYSRGRPKTWRNLLIYLYNITND